MLNAKIPTQQGAAVIVLFVKENDQSDIQFCLEQSGKLQIGGISV